jgi:hypothetical protein
MIRNLAFAAILVSVLAAAGYAAEGDNAALPPSYFEGTWGGAWPFFMDPSAAQAVTITIRPAKKEGVFVVDYEWGAVNARNKTFPSGSLKAKGVQEGDKFTFQWKNKQDRDFGITLHKQTEDSVKARIDRGGPLAPHERPFTETHLKRK